MARPCRSSSLSSGRPMSLNGVRIASGVPHEPVPARTLPDVQLRQSFPELA